MAVYGKKLLDNEGNTILPKTRSNLVYMSDDNTVEDTITKIKSGEIVVGKATDTSKVIGRDAVYSSSGWWYLHNIAGDVQFENCVPYYYAMRTKNILPNRYSDAVNTYGDTVTLEIWGDNNIYFYDSKKRTVIPRGYDPTKMPTNGGTFTGAVKAVGSNQSGTYVRNFVVNNSAYQNQSTGYIRGIRE